MTKVLSLIWSSKSRSPFNDLSRGLQHTQLWSRQLNYPLFFSYLTFFFEFFFFRLLLRFLIQAEKADIGQDYLNTGGGWHSYQQYFNCMLLCPVVPGMTIYMSKANTMVNMQSTVTYRNAFNLSVNIQGYYDNITDFFQMYSFSYLSGNNNS